MSPTVSLSSRPKTRKCSAWLTHQLAHVRRTAQLTQQLGQDASMIIVLAQLGHLYKNEYSRILLRKAKNSNAERVA